MLSVPRRLMLLSPTVFTDFKCNKDRFTDIGNYWERKRFVAQQKIKRTIIVERYYTTLIEDSLYDRENTLKDLLLQYKETRLEPDDETPEFQTVWDDMNSDYELSTLTVGCTGDV